MGMSFEEALDLRKSNPEKYISLSRKTIVKHVEAMLEFQKRGSIVFDYGNNIRGEAKENGLLNWRFLNTGSSYGPSRIVGELLPQMIGLPKNEQLFFQQELSKRLNESAEKFFQFLEDTKEHFHTTEEDVRIIRREIEQVKRALMGVISWVKE